MGKSHMALQLYKRVCNVDARSRAVHTPYSCTRYTYTYSVGVGLALYAYGIDGQLAYRTAVLYLLWLYTVQS